MVRILKSMPMVVMKEGVKESSLNRSRQQDFPTPLSPMRRSFIYHMYVLACPFHDPNLGGSDFICRHTTSPLPYVICRTWRRETWRTYKKIIIPRPSHDGYGLSHTLIFLVTFQMMTLNVLVRTDPAPSLILCFSNSGTAQFGSSFVFAISNLGSFDSRAYPVFLVAQQRVAAACNRASDGLTSGVARE